MRLSIRVQRRQTFVVIFRIEFISYCWQLPLANFCLLFQVYVAFIANNTDPYLGAVWPGFKVFALVKKNSLKYIWIEQ